MKNESCSYQDEVEVLAPGFNCDAQDPIPSYPTPIVGASAGFVLGQAIVCGGANEEYVDCRKHTEGSYKCDRNIECVKTKGDTEWCTGPKIADCYSYEPDVKKVYLITFANIVLQNMSLRFLKEWENVAKLRTRRAYAASVSMPDGSFWMFGGAGWKSVLKTTEILRYKK